jgi:hypothetical protein
VTGTEHDDDFAAWAAELGARTPVGRDAHLAEIHEGFVKANSRQPNPTEAANMRLVALGRATRDREVAGLHAEVAAHHEVLLANDVDDLDALSEGDVIYGVDDKLPTVAIRQSTGWLIAGSIDQEWPSDYTAKCLGGFPIEILRREEHP